jgi:hypothetical protein
MDALSRAGETPAERPPGRQRYEIETAGFDGGIFRLIN